MLTDTFQKLDVSRFRRALTKLHETVGCSKGRIEVTQEGSDEVCVLISKCELEGLERAIEILTECCEYRAMCDEVAQVAAAASGWPVPAASQAPQA
jgi:hypothetical protein